MTRLSRLVVLAVSVAVVSTSNLYAQDPSMGLGVMVGHTTGLNGKVWWDDTIAFDGGLAWSFGEDDMVSLHGDVLWHNWEVLNEAFQVDENGVLPLYYGFGGRLAADDDTRVGLRMVVGASYIFTQAPFDIFLEIAPIMDVVPETKLDMHLNLGARFWF